MTILHLLTIRFFCRIPCSICPPKLVLISRLICLSHMTCENHVSTSQNRCCIHFESWDAARGPLLAPAAASKKQGSEYGSGAWGQHPWPKLGPRGATPFSCPTLGFESHAWDFLWAQRLASWGKKGDPSGICLLAPAR